MERIYITMSEAVEMTGISREVLGWWATYGVVDAFKCRSWRFNLEGLKNVHKNYPRCDLGSKEGIIAAVALKKKH